MRTSSDFFKTSKTPDIPQKSDEDLRQLKEKIVSIDQLQVERKQEIENNKSTIKFIEEFKGSFFKDSLAETKIMEHTQLIKEHEESLKRLDLAKEQTKQSIAQLSSVDSAASTSPRSGF